MRSRFEVLNARVQFAVRAPEGSPGSIRLREATSGRLDPWYSKERETRRAQAELAKTLLNQAPKLAARRDALPYNPMSGVSVPREDAPKVRALTEQELETLRGAVKTMRQNTGLPDIFETQYTLGLRLGEVLALTVDDLDLGSAEGPIVHINSTVWPCPRLVDTGLCGESIVLCLHASTDSRSKESEAIFY